MLLDWKKAESLERPLEVDCTLSKNGVYFRKDIKEVQAGDGENTYTKFVYNETVLSNDYRFDILDMDEYKAKLLEVFKQKRLQENEIALAKKEYISTSKGDFRIKTPTYDFIFCLMALKDLPTGVAAGQMRFYDGTPAPALSQADVQAIYIEFVQAVSMLDAKFTAYKNQITNAQTFDELFEIVLEY